MNNPIARVDPIAPIRYSITLTEDQEWLDWRSDFLAPSGTQADDGLTVTRVGGTPMPLDDWRVITDVYATVQGARTLIGELHVGRNGVVNFQRTADLDFLDAGEAVTASVEIVVSDRNGASVVRNIDVAISGIGGSTSEIIAVDAPMTENWRNFVFDYSLPWNMDAADFDAYVSAFQSASPSVNTIRFPVNGDVFGSVYEDYFWKLSEAYAKAGYQILYYYHDGNVMDSGYNLAANYAQKIGSLDNPGSVFAGWARFLDLLGTPERKTVLDQVWGLEFLNEPVAYNRSSPAAIAAYAEDSADFFRLIAQYVDAGRLPEMPKILINGMGYAEDVALLGTVRVTDPATGLTTDGLSLVRDTIPTNLLIWSMHAYADWATSTPDGLRRQLGAAANDSVLMTETHFRGSDLFSDNPAVNTLAFLLGLEDWARSDLDFGVSWWPGTGPWSQHAFPYIRATGSFDPILREGEVPSSAYWGSYLNFQDGEQFVMNIRHGNMAGLLNFDFVANHLDADRVRAGQADGLEAAAIYGSRFGDVLTGTGDANILLGGLGNDRITAARGENYLFGHEGNDTLLGGRDRDLMSGGDGADRLEGGDGADILDGGAGDDMLIGGLADDTLIGGAGNDSYVVDSTGDRVFETATSGGIDWVQSSVSFSLDASAELRFVERLTLTGTANSTATGNALANVLTGNAGNNVLDGGLGSDTMTGGAGDDTYVVERNTDRVFELATPDGGSDTVQSAVSFNLDASAGVRFVENLTLTGSGNLKATGNALDNLLIGNSGNNVLIGGLGDDTLIGGAGNDSYVVDSTGDRVVETATSGGIDTVQSSVSFSLDANAELRFVERLTLTGTANTSATGNALANVLTGNAGNNILDGGLGSDKMMGGAGDDIYVVERSTDRVFETSRNGGTDTVQSAVSFSLDANGTRFVENLTLTGTGDLTGTGNALDNLLTGNSGNNVLIGALGNDTLIGGAGSDTFVFATAPGAANIDHIGDFDVAEDTIRLDDAVFAGLSLGTLGEVAFAMNLTGTATDVQDRILYESGTGHLYFDADGTGAGVRVQFASLTANLALTHADFLVV